MVISSSVPLLVNIDLKPMDYIGVSGSEQELPQQRQCRKQYWPSPGQGQYKP